MPPSNPWTINEPNAQSSRRSFLGSITQKIGRSRSNASRKSTNSTTSDEPTTPVAPSFRGPADLMNSNPLANPSPATRRPDRPGMNAFTVPSNEPPPAYTPSPTQASGTPLNQLPSANIPASSSTTTTTPATTTTTTTTTPTTTAGGEDPYTFLDTFNTTLLIDDSGSMAGRSWREVSQALSTIAPIVTKHDSDGIDVYFLNHKSSDQGAVSEGVAPGGYRGIKRAATVHEIFERVRPGGGTPTGIRVHNILKPYLSKLEKVMAEGKDMKPLNLIVLTDGVPSDDVESVLLSAAKKLDKLEAPPFQVGVQFFQVGNEEGAREALEELDDGISELVEGGVRDIVDTVTWTGGQSASEGGIGLTGDGILKAVLGAVVKRLDRRPASGEIRRRR